MIRVSNIPPAWATAARKGGALLVGEGLALAAGAMPGLGAATGAAVEAGVSSAAEIAMSRMRKAPGPTVDNKPIVMPQPRQSRFPGLDAWRLRPEDFDKHEGEGLARIRALLDTGHFAEAEALADTLHIINAEDAGNYRFARKGYNLPGSAWKGNRLIEVPDASRFDQAWEALTHVKLRGEPLYGFVSREKPCVRYRRLITDVSRHFGGDHLAIATIHEPA